jgi:hypothetical protein
MEYQWAVDRGNRQAVFGIRLVQLLDDRNIGSGENNNTEVA